MKETQLKKKIAIIGNPNSGKTSLFNALSGQRQKVGNFSGVTVEKKTTEIRLGKQELHLIDFPGLYSIHTITEDEKIVSSILTNPNNENFPHHILYTIDYRYLTNHLLLYMQLVDMGFHVMPILTMADELKKDKNVELDINILEDKLRTRVYQVNSRNSHEVNRLKQEITEFINQAPSPSKPFLPEAFFQSSPLFNSQNTSIYKTSYQAFIGSLQPKKPMVTNGHLPLKKEITSFQIEETLERFHTIEPIVRKVLKTTPQKSSFTDKVDKTLTHRILGPIIFFALMALVFQAIFSWASYPMEMIEILFNNIGQGIRSIVPVGWVQDLLVDGIVAGLGGIVIFIPQIAILFLLISLLEEVGYMSRAVYLFDNIMQKFGMNGRSIVALISGGACAIPAIMSTRTIKNWKERLLTILVTPFISCSARIPVYAVLVAFVVPADIHYGIFNAQGLVFLALYLLGVVAALGSAYLLTLFIEPGNRGSSLLALDLPEYKTPYWRNMWHTVYHKVSSFIIQAGKIILLFSIVLWFLASYGMPGEIEKAEHEAIVYAQENALNETEKEDLIASYRLESSFIGVLGHAIEPAIRPMGFDWKIGIGLLTSFAAREVFISTMATIYNVGSTEDELGISERMAVEINPHTGKKTYTVAVSLALLVFYALAMQCMSTLAVVQKETGTWKYPILQFIFMTVLAYVSALLVYQIFS